MRCGSVFQGLGLPRIGMGGPMQMACGDARSRKIIKPYVKVLSLR